MAHKEIEVKFPLTEQEYCYVLDLLKQKLTPVPLKQDDFVCKLKTDENFRMRCQPDITLLTHKKRIYDTNDVFLYCQESECPLDIQHDSEIQNILKSLNLQPISSELYQTPSKFWQHLHTQLAPKAKFFVQIHKNRTEFKKDNLTYVLDDIKDLGYFLEIELLVPLSDKTEETTVRQNLRAKLAELGLSDRAPIIHGYAVLMHQKMVSKD